MVSARSIGTTIFTAIYAAILQRSLKTKIPTYIAQAAATDGLAASSIPRLIGAIASSNQTGLQSIPGATADIIADGELALRHAYADSIRLIFITTALFGVVACILCFFLGDVAKVMTYRVDAPVEKLYAKRHEGEREIFQVIEASDESNLHCQTMGEVV